MHRPTDIERDEMLQAALALAARGLHVFPCAARGKHPAIENGFKSATTDPAVIGEWWRRNPDLNIGIAAGAISGIFVLDIDNLDAEAALNELETRQGKLPDSVEVITARGRHVWFRHPGRAVRCSASRIAPGVDVKGDGGYVLTPPSMHPSGRRYEWSVDCAPLAAAPDWLIDMVVTPATGDIMPPTAPSEWRDLVTAGVREGERDCTITRLVGHLLRRRIDPFVALMLAQSWNVTHCAPPLPATDIERIVASIAGRELRRRGAL